jgi:hypothetical protein
LSVQFTEALDVLIPRHEPSNAEMEKLMPERSSDSGRVFKPISNGVNFPVYDGARRPFIIGTFNARISQRGQCHDLNLCHPKWLNRLLNRLLNNAD